MYRATCALLGSLIGLCALGTAQNAPARNDEAKTDSNLKKVIYIDDGLGDIDYFYVEKPLDKKQLKEKVVFVGDTVVWKNVTDVAHTATSGVSPNRNDLFRVKPIRPGAKKKPSEAAWEFTPKLYKDAKKLLDAGARAAGAKGVEAGPQGEIRLRYFCEHHAGQESVIILKPKPAQNK